MSHADIKRLGYCKIVATPSSGAEIPEIYKLYKKLDEVDYNKLKQIYRKSYKWELGIFTLDDSNSTVQEDYQKNGGNKIIFYVVDYLDLLAKASNKTTYELLNIFTIGQSDNYMLDLIKIAFGDVFGNGYLDGPLVTDEGKAVLGKYQVLLA